MKGPPQANASIKARLDAVFGKSVVVGRSTFATGTEKLLVLRENYQGVLEGYYSSRRVGVMMIVLRHRASASPDYEVGQDGDIAVHPRFIDGDVRLRL